MRKVTRIEDAIAHIESNWTVFLHGGPATPKLMIEELVHQSKRLRNVELVHLHTHGDVDYARPEYKESFKVSSLFVGANMRGYFDFDRVDYIPCFLSEIPGLFRKQIKKLDCALVQVARSQDGEHFSLGTSVDVAKSAVESAGFVIAQVNDRMPFTFGDGMITADQIDVLVEASCEIYESIPKPPSEVEKQIGMHIARLIEDGSCLQMGIGNIPDAVLAGLHHHKNLGVHTEMWSDGLLPLIEKGVVNNSLKTLHPGKIVSSFVMGSRKLYDFIHQNKSVLQMEASYVNNPRNISINPKVMAINSAVEIDLTGQVCADSIGAHIISGVGGQIDFIRGASLSDGGKPIIAITSRTQKGVPRIVPTLKAGAGVVTTRAHIHWVATEYGVVDLFGKNLHQRAKALIEIAHPDDRENLGRTWRDTYLAK